MPEVSSFRGKSIFQNLDNSNNKLIPKNKQIRVLRKLIYSQTLYRMFSIVQSNKNNNWIPLLHL